MYIRQSSINPNIRTITTDYQPQWRRCRAAEIATAASLRGNFLGKGGRALCFVTIIKGEHPTHLLPCLFIKWFMRLSTGPRDLIVTILAQKQCCVPLRAVMTTICLMCKQSFSRVKRYPNKFCGPVCSMRWRNVQLKMKRRAANTARGRKVERQEATSLGEQVDVKW